MPNETLLAFTKPFEAHMYLSPVVKLRLTRLLATLEKIWMGSKQKEKVIDDDDGKTRKWQKKFHGTFLLCLRDDMVLVKWHICLSE